MPARIQKSGPAAAQGGQARQEEHGDRRGFRHRHRGEADKSAATHGARRGCHPGGKIQCVEIIIIGKVSDAVLESRVIERT